MDKVPVQVQGQTNRRDTQLTAFEDNKEVLVFSQASGHLIHHIRLGAKQLIAKDS